MRTAVKLFTLVVVLGLSTGADAKGAKGGSPKGASNKALAGIVVKIDDAANPKTLTYKTGDATSSRQITVSIDQTTVILLNNAAAKLTDLRPDMPVGVTAENGVASKVESPPAATGGADKGSKAGKGRAKGEALPKVPKTPKAGKAK
jgi:hypothetical protein